MVEVLYFSKDISGEFHKFFREVRPPGPAGFVERYFSVLGTSKVQLFHFFDLQTFLLPACWKRVFLAFDSQDLT